MRNTFFFLAIASSFALACSGAGAPLLGGDGGSGGSSGGSSGSGSSSGVSGGGSGSGSGSSSSGGGSGGSSGSSSSGGGSGSGSGGSSSGGSSGSSSSSGGGTCNPTAPDGGACNSLGPSLTPVTVQCVSGTLPPAQGGAITNGVYVLATATYYGASCPSEVDRDRWLVCGTNWQTLQAFSTNGGPEMINADNFNVTQSGTNLQIQGVCGVTQAFSFGYSATPTTISFYIPTPNTTGEGRVDVYTLQ